MIPSNVNQISVAKERLGWAPTIALRDGLRATIGYFDRLLASDFDERVHVEPT